MVRSRSETNLNRIFVDLCTSPEFRPKVAHQRQYHPPLPTLKSIKSNSCSNIDELLQNTLDDERSVILAPRPSKPSTSIPLVPVESTGFVVQSPMPLINHSLSLLETLTINHTRNTSSLPMAAQKPSFHPSLSVTPSTSSQDSKQTDLTQRIRNRLRSHGPLRKFFLP